MYIEVIYGDPDHYKNDLLKLFFFAKNKIKHIEKNWIDLIS